MANSSGLNERPSRTSFRGVATLYHGSIAILLRSLHACEQLSRRLLQACKIRISQGLEGMLCVVHSVSHTVGNNDVSGKLERLNVPLCLLKRTLHTCAQTLGLDDEVAVLRNPRQGPEDSYIDVPPLHCDTLRCPTERTQ